MKKGGWSDEKLVEIIKEGGADRKKALTQIYNLPGLGERVNNFVKFKGGTKEEAETVWIETIIIVDRNIRLNKFKGDSSLSTYVFSVAKFYWFNWVRTKRTDIKSESIEGSYTELPDIQNPELIFLKTELEEQLKKLLSLLSEKCQTILKMWSNNAKYDEIAKSLGVEKNGTLRKQKLVCLRKLREYLMLHPELIPNYYNGES